MKTIDWANSQYTRTATLLGTDAINKLRNSKVAVFGLGGVGGYVVESLSRCGVGLLDITDKDTVELSNLNRQIYALHSTIGKYKAEVATERIADIDSTIVVQPHITFVTPDNVSQWDFGSFDCVVDAIDNVTAKLAIIEQCHKVNTPIISCMGTGNKLNPTKLTITDIYKTTVCPLARVMRRELKKRNIPSLTVLYSTEEPFKHPQATEGNRMPPMSISYVPSVAGMIISSWVVEQLIKK